MSQIIDLAGQRFDRLTVVRRAKNTSDGHARWECRCDCGNCKVVSAALLRSGKTTSCGCYRKERQSLARRLRLEGRTFGRLTAIRLAGKNSSGHYLWLCRCSCGASVEVSASALTSKKKPTRSCGCLIGETSAFRSTKQMIGVRHGRLIGLWRAISDSEGAAYWLFRCDCGNVKVASGVAVRQGQILSCGCLRKEKAAARGRVVGPAHLKADGIEAYAANPEHANRQSCLYLVRVADRFLKFGITFDLRTRGRGDYQEVLFKQTMPRAECWAVEQRALAATVSFQTMKVPRTLLCGGFSEFREGLPAVVAVRLLGMLCAKVKRVGWQQLLEGYAAS